MRFKVPKNVDIEDRIVGSLTGRQFLWILGGVALLFPVYHWADFSLFIGSAIVIMILSVSFAFVRPYGQSLFTFITNFLLYNFKEKHYLWKREGAQYKNEKKTDDDEELLIIKKGFPEEKVADLARILDAEGEVNQETARSAGLEMPIVTIKGKQPEVPAAVKIRNRERELRSTNDNEKNIIM